MNQCRTTPLQAIWENLSLIFWANSKHREIMGSTTFFNPSIQVISYIKNTQKIYFSNLEPLVYPKINLFTQLCYRLFKFHQSMASSYTNGPQNLLQQCYMKFSLLHTLSGNRALARLGYVQWRHEIMTINDLSSPCPSQSYTSQVL